MTSSIFGWPTFCEHLKTELRAMTCSNGSIQRKYQCLGCGRSLGNAQKNDGTPLPPWDTRLRDEGEARFALWSRQRSDAAAKKFQDFVDWYHTIYIHSQAFDDRKRLVIARAGGLCEGCRVRPAVSIHHSPEAYTILRESRSAAEPFGRELLYLLVALCADCHFNFIHAGKESAGV